MIVETEVRYLLWNAGCKFQRLFKKCNLFVFCEHSVPHRQISMCIILSLAAKEMGEFGNTRFANVHGLEDRPSCFGTVNFLNAEYFNGTWFYLCVFVSFCYVYIFAITTWTFMSGLGFIFRKVQVQILVWRPSICRQVFLCCFLCCLQANLSIGPENRPQPLTSVPSQINFLLASFSPRLYKTANVILCDVGHDLYWGIFHFQNVTWFYSAWLN